MLLDANILVIDDELANLKLMDAILTSSGFNNVQTLQDPFQAVEVYKRSRPDAILLDLNMPKKDGFTVLKELLESCNNYIAPVLVLTAQDDNDIRRKALQSGARDYVTKPFDRVELVARLRNLVEVHRYQRSLTDKNTLLEDMVRQRTDELHETRLQIVQRLGRAAEYRDNETGMHILRMSTFSKLLGSAMGMSSYESELLLHAAPMHDIGKIGIPDHILLKPGKLDPDEWEIMKTHASIGADILSGEDSDLLRMAREIALTHHEKWDGSGYPNGLQGEKIPLVGRICALADVFDALTSERPYKKAWSWDDAVNFIVQNKGTHFEPRLVEHFMGLMPEIKDIKERYSDDSEELF